MATYHGPSHAARSLSPITELTTPASARSINLPHVDTVYDYHDESPIQPLHNHNFDSLPSADGDGDGDSIYSHGSTKTVVPEPSPTRPDSSAHSTSPSPSPPANVRAFPPPTEGLSPPPQPSPTRPDSSAHDTSPLPSTPANVRAFPSPTEGLPPPPRSMASSLRGSTHRPTPPASPGLAYLEDSGPNDTTPTAPASQAGLKVAALEPSRPAFSDERGTDQEHEQEQDHEDDEVDRASVASVSSAGIAGVGAGMKSTAPGPRSRPSSLQGFSPGRKAESPLHFATSFHPSLINIPPVPSPGFSPARDPTSTRGSPKVTPQPSRANSVDVIPKHSTPPEPPIRVTSYQSLLFNTPIVASPGFSPAGRDPISRGGTPRIGTPVSSRPSSIHASAQSIKPETPVHVASFHHSLVNIPIIPSPGFASDGRDPVSRRGSPRTSSLTGRPDSARAVGQASVQTKPEVQVASFHPSLVNIPIIPSPGFSPGNRDPISRRGSPRAGTPLSGRPKSIHGTAQGKSGIPVRIASFHESLVNIPTMPSPVPAPAPATSSTQNRSPSSRRTSLKATPAVSPTRSRPTSPKSRPSTLKKRPMSLQASRPTSWHSQKSVISPSSTIKAKKTDKGKRKSLLSEEGSGASSNDTHSDVTINAPRPGGPARRKSRIPSLLLSLFEPNSSRQSRAASTLTSPSTSSGGHSPHTPISPNLASVDEIPDESGVAAGAAPPLAAIRTSGTFGIQDDGSVHLLLDEDVMPRSSVSSGPGRPMRRRDSSGTVMSATIDRVLIMGNPDPPRPSIDEDDELEPERRTLTPFEPENPTSPLETVLGSNKGVAATGSPVQARPQPERRSVDGPHNLLVIPGRSDVSEKAQSLLERRVSESTSGADHLTTTSHTRAQAMVDDWTQTSRPTSALSTSKRPLPRPPSRSTEEPQVPISPVDGLPSRLRERVRPVSLPPLLSSANYTYPQPVPGPASRQEQGAQSAIPTSPPPTSDLPLLIASHLLSNHATALMRQSAGMAEGAEMMKRMADESMQWGAMLLHMASGHAAGQGIPAGMPMGYGTSAVQRQDWQPREYQPSHPHHDGMPTSATDTLFNPMSSSRPVYDDPLPQRGESHTPQPSVQGHPYARPEPQYPEYRDREGHSTTHSARHPYAQPDIPFSDRSPTREHRASESEMDRYTPLPPRISPRRSRSNFDNSTGFYRKVDDIGRKGWDDLHRAEESWVKGMSDLKMFLDQGPGPREGEQEGGVTRRSTGMATVASATEHDRQTDRARYSSGQRDAEDDRRPDSGSLHQSHERSPTYMLPKFSRSPVPQRQSESRNSELQKRWTPDPTADQRNSHQSGRTVSMIRTDESFLPSPSDLLPSASTETTNTDSPFPPSFDLMTPPDDRTIRAKQDARYRQALSPDSRTFRDNRDERPLSMSVPTTAVSPNTDFQSSSGDKGYDSNQIHPVLYNQGQGPKEGQKTDSSLARRSTTGQKKFDLTTPPPAFPQPLPRSEPQGQAGEKKIGPASFMSTSSKRGRKLKKRSSQQLDQSPSLSQTQTQTQTRQGSTTTGAGDTIPSSARGKKHWWSRRSRGTDGSEDWKNAAPITAI